LLVEFPTKHELMINLNIAKGLDITSRQPSSRIRGYRTATTRADLVDIGAGTL
jgi:hypothetical protein